MKGARSLSVTGEGGGIHFPDGDFERLVSSWSSLSTNYQASPTTSLVRHVIDCVAVLRDLNLDKGRTADGEGVLTSAICNSSFNTLSTSLERILLEAMTCQLPPESPAEAGNILELGCSILRQFPDAAKLDKTGSSQKTLLHRVAIKPAHGVQSIKSVFSYSRESIENTDAMGALPLHHATHASPPDINIVRTLLELYPAAAAVPDKAGYLPLHWAVNSTNPKVEIVRLLLKAYPEGATKPCKGGSLPLHWSVDRDKPQLGIVEELTNAYRAGLTKACSLGWLPIHRCVDRADPKQSVLKWLVNNYPKGLRVANCDGQLPLHRLVDRSSPALSSIQILATAYPDALLVADAEGYLPLHLALDGDNPSSRVVTALLHMCPESASVTTIDGLLPLHCALNCCLTAIVPREIILALLQAYPQGALQEAVDMVPTDPEANPDDWDGPWKQVKWTPLSRAEELEDDDLIEDIQLAISNPSPTRYQEHVNIGIISRRNSSDSLSIVSNDLSTASFSAVPHASSEGGRLGPGWSGQTLKASSFNETDDYLINSTLVDSPPLTNNPMPGSSTIDSLGLGGSLKANTPHSRSANNLLAPETLSPNSPFDRNRKVFSSGGQKRSPELGSLHGGTPPRSAGDESKNNTEKNKLPSIAALRIPPVRNARSGSVVYDGIYSSQVDVGPPTPAKELAIEVLMSPHASRDDASVYSLMSRGDMSVDSSQFSANSSRRTSGMWVRGAGDADSVSSSTDGGTFFRRKSNRRGNSSGGSKYGPGDAAMLHDFAAILEQDEESPRAGNKTSSNPVRQLKQGMSPLLNDKKQRYRRARKQQKEAELVTTIISREKPVSAPSTSSLLGMV